MKYFVGWGALLELCFDELCQSIGQRPDFICDNNPEKQQRYLRGIPCISLQATMEDAEAEFVITVRKHHQLAEQIRDLGHHRIRVAHFDHAYHKLVRLAPYEAGSQKEIPCPTEFFRDKDILITGASRGLGALLATELARHGANLILHARESSHLQETITRCKSHGRILATVSADLESPEAVKKLLGTINEVSPQLDVIYNNAGFFHPRPGSHYEIPAGDFERCFRINALAPILIANALIPGMLAKGFGRIINVSTALQHQPSLGAYAVSKAALDKFVHDLAPTLDGSGVAINLVDPGSLRTDMNPTGLHPADSALNGLLLAALYDQGNGRWLTAQDYSELSLDEAHTEMLHRFIVTSPHE